MWIHYDLGYYRQQRRRLIGDIKMCRQGYLGPGMLPGLRKSLAYARRCYFTGVKVDCAA